MTSTLNPGGRIDTTRYGPGTVVRITRAGAVVSLDKLGGLEIDIPFEEIDTSATDAVRQGSSGAPDVQARQSASFSPYAPPTQSRQLLDKEQLRARRSIEALRFGIVPTHSIAGVTLGYVELDRWVLGQLPSDSRTRPNVCEVCGPFGTGKSHTMAAIRHIAAERGFATAHVEVDGNSVSLSDPASVLRQLWKTLSGAGFESATPLVDLNVRAIDNGNAQVSAALARFERVQSNLLTVRTVKRKNGLDRHSEMLEKLLCCGDEVTAKDVRDILMSDTAINTGWGSYGDDTIIDPKRLIGLRTEDRPNDFVECLLGYSVLARLAGFQGLVVTIDEFEVESANLSRDKIERLKGVIMALATWFGGTSKKIGPLTLFVATVGQNGSLGDRIVNALMSDSGGRYPLKQWSRSAHRELAERIFALYQRAYVLDAPFDDSEAARAQETLDESDVEGSGLVRAFIKQYVAILDATYGPVAA